MSHTLPDTRAGSLIDTLADADALLAARAKIVGLLAPLRALYGGNGYMGERQFKLDEARIATVVRAKLAADGVKITEPMVDAATRTHPHYIAALEMDVKQRAEWIGLEEQLNEIEWRLRVRSSDSYLLGAEAKLQ